MNTPRAMSRRVLLTVTAILLAVATAMIAPVLPAAAAPQDRPHITKITELTERRWVIDVYSPAMRKVETFDVFRARDHDRPQPILYALNGAGQGKVEKSGWFDATDIVDFYRDKNVTVVSPRGGGWSYYTDWIRPDPYLGRMMWQTFLTKELPPLFDKALNTNARRAIMGLSMSGSAAQDLAIHSGDLYSGVVSLSGCGLTSDPVGRSLQRLVVGRAGGEIDNMWGPDNSPGVKAHDVRLNAEKLRGKKLYIASRTGAPGALDTMANPRVERDPLRLADQIASGGTIEVATHRCSVQLVEQLHALQIPVHTDLDQPGSHSWGYWEQDMRKSWPTIADALGVLR